MTGTIADKRLLFYIFHERNFLDGAESAPKPEKRPQTPRRTRQIEAEKRDFRPCFDPLFDPSFHAVKNVVFRMYRIY